MRTNGTSLNPVPYYEEIRPLRYLVRKTVTNIDTKKFASWLRTLYSALIGTVKNHGYVLSKDKSNCFAEMVGKLCFRDTAFLRFLFDLTRFDVKLLHSFSWAIWKVGKVLLS